MWLMSSNRHMDDAFPIDIHRRVHDSHNTPMPHGHDFIELVFVEHGGARHLFGTESYDLRRGDVFVINPGEYHTFEVPKGERLEIINCLFQPHLIQESILRDLAVSDSMDYFYIHPFLNPRERFNHLLNLEGDNASRVLKTLETMMQELQYRSAGYQTVIRLRMIEMLVLLSRFYGHSHHVERSSHGDHRRIVVMRICGYLERHYQQKITLASLADLFNISTRQMGRIFHEEMGASVIEKLQQIRIEKAKLLLSQTDEKVVEVAAMVGYEDPAFFSRLFAREVGCSPGRFRTNKLKGESG